MISDQKIEPTSSNSRLHAPVSPHKEENEPDEKIVFPPDFFQEIPENIVKQVSIDKLRIVGDFNIRYVTDIIAINDKNLDIDFRDDTYFKGSYITSENDTLNFEYNDRKAKATNASNFWIEWNPNKVDDSSLAILMPIFSNINNAHITRADIAVDCNHDLSRYTIYKDNPVGHSVWYGRDNAVETRYFGSMNSDRYIKIYNKKLELEKKQRKYIDDDVLWRFEITLKTKRLYDIASCLEGINLYLPNYYRILDIRSRAMMMYFMAEPDHLNDVDRKTKTKYRKLIKETQDFKLTDIIDVEIQKEKNRLISQMNTYLDYCNTSKKIDFSLVEKKSKTY